jgi:HK97 family phage major capsid protein
MPKERFLKDVVGERSKLLERRKEIAETAAKESRGFSDEERAELERNAVEISLRNAEEQDIAREEQRMSAEVLRKAATGGGAPRATLQRAICELVEGEGFSEDVAAIHERGLQRMKNSAINNAPKKDNPNRRGGMRFCVPIGDMEERLEHRAEFTATGATGYGSDLVQTDEFRILPELRANLVLAKAGARFVPGLRDNINIPAYSGTQAFWEGENDPSPDGGGTFSHKYLRPRRLTSKILISRQLLIQDNNLGIEAYLRESLVNSITDKLQATILGNAAHADTVPDGIFTGLPTTVAPLDWANIVDMETAVRTKNALNGRLAYVTHSAVYGAMKKTAQQSTNPGPPSNMLNFLVDKEGDRLNGHPLFETSVLANFTPSGEGAVPQYGIAFGNWNDLFIGQWGGLELVVDPLTLADQATIRIIVNSWWDAVVVRDESIARAWTTTDSGTSAGPATAKEVTK